MCLSAKERRDLLLIWLELSLSLSLSPLLVSTHKISPVPWPGLCSVRAFPFFSESFLEIPSSAMNTAELSIKKRQLTH